VFANVIFKREHTLKIAPPEYETLLTKLSAALGPDRKPLLISIDGREGAGKTSLSNWLAWQLGILLQAHGRAINRPSRNEGVKFVRCLRAASILQALIVATELRGFGRVDSPKANARPVNFERVAVDNAGLPGEIICGPR
jgi:hypothetical protein